MVYTEVILVCKQCRKQEKTIYNNDFRYFTPFGWVYLGFDSFMCGKCFGTHDYLPSTRILYNYFLGKILKTTRDNHVIDYCFYRYGIQNN